MSQIKQISNSIHPHPNHLQWRLPFTFQAPFQNDSTHMSMSRQTPCTETCVCHGKNQVANYNVDCTMNVASKNKECQSFCNR